MLTSPFPHGSASSPSAPDPGFLFPTSRALSFRVLVGSYVEDVLTEFHTIVRFFRLLMRPCLSALRFDVPGTFYAHLDLPSIQALCPNIRTSVSEFCDLEIIRTYVISRDLLSGLAQAKQLRRLWMYLPHQFDPGPERVNNNGSLQLRTLDIYVNSLASHTGLLRRTSLNKVMVICIHCSPFADDGDSSQALVDMSLISLQHEPLELLWFLF
ncbi:hypothetical protein F5141DRAFT_1213781 [Pisolithus sp. B1]|nr:hypothetical protein F5141DRAFT_1213781 [Pisolithus sp. B1]